MIETLRQILEGVLERLSHQITTYLPGLLAAMIILACTYILARIIRWLLTRIFKGIAFDRFLLQSGISGMLDQSGRLGATRLVSEMAYWAVLLTGFLNAVSAFNTQLSAHIVESVVMLLPRLVIAALIIMAGIWLGQYLGRSVLVWAVNEGMPSPRRWSSAVRLMLVFVAVVVAADQLNFARHVFLAAFLLVAGGGILAVSLAIGLGLRDVVRHSFRGREPSLEEPLERSLRDHL